MTQVKNGDKIRIHYHGKLNDGSTFDSSEGREPLEFQVGSGQVIKGFDEGVLAMSVGEKKRIVIPAKDAYGEPSMENVFEHPRSNFPADITPEVGMQLYMSDQDGNNFPVMISALTDTAVVLDANHPLAGKELTFDLELVEIL